MNWQGLRNCVPFEVNVDREGQSAAGKFASEIRNGLSESVRCR
jgi:hypothetical protein